MEKLQKQFSFTGRLKSFSHAFRGLFLLIRSEHNFRIHLLASLAVVVMGWLCKFGMMEWALITFSMGFVLSAEIFNSSVEYLTDLYSPQHSYEAGRIKDISAAGVLISSLTAVIVGILLFLPKIISHF